MIFALASILAPVFIGVGIGFVWSRRGGSYDSEFTTQLVMFIGAPCLVFSALSSIELDQRILAQMAVAAVMALATYAIVGVVVLRTLGLPTHTYLGPLLFPNSGNVGLPLCLFAFGDEGLALATVIFTVVSITHFTLGIWVWSGELSTRELLRTPLTWSVLLALCFLLSATEVPGWLANTTRLLGGFTIPLMLMTLGVSLSRMQIDRVPRSVGLAVLRLAMGFGTGVGIATVLELEGTPRGVVILQCSMPAAVFNYMLAQRYGRSPQEVASVVFFSTVIAFALLPVLLLWLI